MPSRRWWSVVRILFLLDPTDEVLDHLVLRVLEDPVCAIPNINFRIDAHFSADTEGVQRHQLIHSQFPVLFPVAEIHARLV